MKSTGNPPALAAAADLLSDQLRSHLERLAGLLRPHAAAVERRFLRRLRELGFNPKQRKALAAITPGAAATMPAEERLLPDFFEQVEYSGRRLAKLNLAPGRIVEALREYDQLLAPLFRRLPEQDRSNLGWTLEQLHFSVILTLNNAFYQVRESETRAYEEILHAELESGTLDELLLRMLGTLSRFCLAQAGVLYLLDRETSRWTLKATTIEDDRDAPAAASLPNTPARFRKLSQPRCLTSGAWPKQLVLDQRWQRRYRSCWSVPLAIRGRVAGVMQFGFSSAYQWLPREMQLLSAAAERCLLAAEKARLTEQLAERERQVLRLASRMMQIEERERKRISSELHDEAGQSLLCVRLQLEMLEQAGPRAAAHLKAGLAEARSLTERAIVEIRRLVGDLSPAILEQLGLAAALRQLAGRLRRLHKIHVKLHLSLGSELPKNLKQVVYRLTQECFNNIARHSFASHVNLFLTSTDVRLRLRIQDDGVGFNAEEAVGKRGSYGLAGMRERVELFGGAFRVLSRPRRGTTVWIELPIPKREED